MKITYKIEGQPVDRNIFRSMLTDVNTFDAWENVVAQHKDEIEAKLASIIFKLNNKKMHVLTETELLFKLTFQVNKDIHQKGRNNFSKQLA